MKAKINRKLCILTTIPTSIKAFYQGQIDALNRAGFSTAVVCANDDQLQTLLPKETEFYPVEFSRVISPIQDIKALWKLIKFFKKKKFAMVQYSTPKASMLGSIAAFVTRVPIRIYILWGLYYTGQYGLKRFLLKSIEKLICTLSTHVVPIAHEMVDFAEQQGLTRRDKCDVMLNGSACGVDLERFNPELCRVYRSEIRKKYNIPDDGIVIGSVSRLTGDKGINELIEAFEQLSKDNSKLYLMLLGDQEIKDRLLPSTDQIINSNIRIRVTGWQDDPRPFYTAMDIFCLPTYREGFGEVNLEAQALCLPVVSTNVIGPRESVEDGVTGFLVEAQSSQALLEPLIKLIKDKNLRQEMGKAGRKRIETMFDRKDMIKTVVEHRLHLLNHRSKQNL